MLSTVVSVEMDGEKKAACMDGRDNVATSGGLMFQGIAGGENLCEFW